LPETGIRGAKGLIVRFRNRAEQDALVVVGARELLLITVIVRELTYESFLKRERT
jgi:hypothetical protein